MINYKVGDKIKNNVEYEYIENAVISKIIGDIIYFNLEDHGIFDDYPQPDFDKINKYDFERELRDGKISIIKRSKITNWKKRLR